MPVSARLLPIPAPVDSADDLNDEALLVRFSTPAAVKPLYSLTILSDG